MTEANEVNEVERVVIPINVPKAKVKLELIWSELDTETKLAIIQAGAEKIVQAATAKFTKANQKDEEELAESAKGAAEAKLAEIHEGKWKPGRKASSTGKVAGVVMTEARRLAKNIVKAQIKAANQRISDYEAKAITEAANLYLSEHEELIAQASASIEASKALASKAAMDVAAIPKSPSKVAKNEQKKAEAKAATLAKNAGKPGPQKSTLKAQMPVPRGGPRRSITLPTNLAL